MSIQILDEAGPDQSNENTTNELPTSIVLNGNAAPMSPPASSSGIKPSELTQTTAPVAILTPLASSNGTPSPESIIPAPKLCGVCNETPYKYKCPRCALPSCSIVCSTLHKATHPPISPPAPTPAPSAVVQPNVKKARAGTQAAAGLASPFAALSTSTEVKQLFKRYPNLAANLEGIYEAMQPPIAQTPDMREKLTAQHKQQRAWTQDRGMEAGRQALDEARDEWGRDGEGVREFGELVLRLVAGQGANENGDEARRTVEMEMQRENARIVKALLDGELQL